jgi:hypothetical protein
MQGTLQAPQPLTVVLENLSSSARDIQRQLDVFCSARALELAPPSLKMVRKKPASCASSAKSQKMG